MPRLNFLLADPNEPSERIARHLGVSLRPAALARQWHALRANAGLAHSEDSSSRNTASVAGARASADSSHLLPPSDLPWVVFEWTC